MERKKIKPKNVPLQKRKKKMKPKNAVAFWLLNRVAAAATDAVSLMPVVNVFVF